MRRIRRHLNFANVASAIALFVALGGGTAVALTGSNTVFTDDIADDNIPASGGNPAGGLVAADLRASSVGTSEVANNSLTLSDLNPGSRAHKIEFSGGVGTSFSPVTVGNVRVDGDCSGGTQSFLDIFLKNLTAQSGTYNALLTNQTAAGGAVTLHTVGHGFAGGESFLLHHNDAPFGSPLAQGDFNRVEGQVVFQTPGRVTTINFHAFTGPPTFGCQFYGTAVTSNLN